MEDVHYCLSKAFFIVRRIELRIVSLATLLAYDIYNMGLILAVGLTITICVMISNDFRSTGYSFQRGNLEF
jgi:hypothetical protein